MPLKTFIIYARNDKAHKDDLLRHLKPLVGAKMLDLWHDGDINPGEEWEIAIKKNLKASEIILVLVSVHCLNSDFIQTDELETALLKMKDGTTRIIPIIVSPCGWKYLPIFRNLQGLPEDMKAITKWENRDEAWTNVIDGIATTVEHIHVEKAEKAQKEKELLAKIEAEKQAEIQRKEREILEKIAFEKAEKERLKNLAFEKQENERLEKLAVEKEEKERLEKIVVEKAEKERLDKLAVEKQEKERLEKIAFEKAEKERLEKLAVEKQEKERLEKLAFEQEAKKRLEKLASQEKEHLEKLAFEKQEKERLDKLAVEKAEKERLEKLAVEKQEKERLEKLAVERKNREQERIAAQQRENERLEREQSQNAYTSPSKKALSTPTIIGGTVGILLILILGITQPWKTDTQPQKDKAISTAAIDIPSPSSKHGSYTETVNGVSFVMKAIPGRTFYLGETEVTQALWKAVMGSNPSKFKGDNLPVETVSWNDAQDFIKKLNQATNKIYRLPKEAEWEYAANGGQKYTYAGSNNIDEVAWYDGNSGNKTHPVGKLKANGYGLYDMSGNVWEWCEDISDGSNRVLRGGSWSNGSNVCASANRHSVTPTLSDGNLGFRLSRTE